MHLISIAEDVKTAACLLQELEDRRSYLHKALEESEKTVLNLNRQLQTTTIHNTDLLFQNAALRKENEQLQEVVDKMPCRMRLPGSNKAEAEADVARAVDSDAEDME